MPEDFIIEVPEETAESSDVEAMLPADQSETVETIEVPTEDVRLFMDTSFDEYSVSEGLLLLIFVVVLAEFFLNIVRRWF